jgi:hypothetical protein
VSNALITLGRVTGSRPHSLSTLPRSLHRPVAVTDGSFSSNLNKTGVRLWTDHAMAARPGASIQGSRNSVALPQICRMALCGEGLGASAESDFQLELRNGVADTAVLRA